MGECCTKSGNAVKMGYCPFSLALFAASALAVGYQMKLANQETTKKQ